MWLHRHRDELPIPIIIGGRRFWIESEFDTYFKSLSLSRMAKKTAATELDGLSSFVSSSVVYDAQNGITNVQTNGDTK